MFRSTMLLRVSSRRLLEGASSRSFSKVPKASRHGIPSLLHLSSNSISAVGQRTLLATRGQQMALFSSGGGSGKEGGHALEKSKYIDETMNPK